MNLKRMNCFLCVDKPAPSDLKKHIMFYHMIENDIAVEKIYKMHSHHYDQVTTQTTVTWTREFSYYDHRSENKEPSLPAADRQFTRKRKKPNRSTEQVGRDSGMESSSNLMYTKKVKYQSKETRHNIDTKSKSLNDDKPEIVKSKTFAEEMVSYQKDDEVDEVKSNISSTKPDEGANKEAVYLDEEITVEPVTDFYDYDENETSEPPNHQIALNSPATPLNDDESLKGYQDVIKKFGNSISIINFQDSGNSEYKHKYVKDLPHFDGNKYENEEAETDTKVLVTDADDGYPKRRKSDTSSVANMQEVAERLGISISISDSRDLEENSTEKCIKPVEQTARSPMYITSFDSESLLKNGSTQEKDHLGDSVELDHQIVEAEKEKNVVDDTFLSSDKENRLLGSSLARLVSCGLLSINKIENDSKIKDEDKEFGERENVCVGSFESLEEAENVADSSSEKEFLAKENGRSCNMEDEAFNSDEEFDDD